ncbi:unnamed protein product, partial [Ectocarpus sp. 4 AP-2014]
SLLDVKDTLAGLDWIGCRTRSSETSAPPPTQRRRLSRRPWCPSPTLATTAPPACGLRSLARR